MSEAHCVLTGCTFGNCDGDPEVVSVKCCRVLIEGSPRNPRDGVPSTVFRDDLVYELTSVIVEDRPALPGFDHGAMAQYVADAVLASNEDGRWKRIDAELG